MRTRFEQVGVGQRPHNFTSSDDLLTRRCRRGVGVTSGEPSSATPAGAQVRGRPRIESLSDLVFGLALSLGAFALVANPPNDATTLYSDLATFGFSFLILMVVWLAYTRLMTVLAHEHQSTVHLNVVLLFSVSIEPFLLNVLVRQGLSSDFFGAVSQAYAVDLGVMISILGFFAWVVAGSESGTLGERVRGGFRREALNRWFAAGLFLVSAAPIFDQFAILGEPLRLWIWVVAVGLVWATRLGAAYPRAKDGSD